MRESMSEFEGIDIMRFREESILIAAIVATSRCGVSWFFLLTLVGMVIMIERKNDFVEVTGWLQLLNRSVLN